MKIKKGYTLKNSMGNYVVIATGDRRKDFMGLMKLNDVAAKIWNYAKEGKSIEEAAKNLAGEYTGITYEKALEDVKKFVDGMIEKGFFEE